MNRSPFAGRPISRTGLGGVGAEELVGRDTTVALVLDEGLDRCCGCLGSLESLEPRRERLIDDLPHAPVRSRGLHLHRAIELRVEVDAHLHAARLPACWVCLLYTSDAADEEDSVD